MLCNDFQFFEFLCQIFQPTTIITSIMCQDILNPSLAVYQIWCSPKIPLPYNSCQTLPLHFWNLQTSFLHHIMGYITGHCITSAKSQNRSALVNHYYGRQKKKQKILIYVMNDFSIYLVMIKKLHFTVTCLPMTYFHDCRERRTD